jgi:hypothetical protein
MICLIISWSSIRSAYNVPAACLLSSPHIRFITRSTTSVPLLVQIYICPLHQKIYMECTSIHGQDYKSAGDAACNHDSAVCRQSACEQSMCTRAGDELLPSRSHSHLPLQAIIMWFCHKDPESLHTFVTRSVHNDTWKYVLSERKVIVTNIGEDNKHSYARLEEGKGEHKHCVFLLF